MNESTKVNNDLTSAERLSGGGAHGRRGQGKQSTLKAKAIQENIKADIDVLLKKYGVANVRNFARKLLVQVAMEETVKSGRG